MPAADGTAAVPAAAGPLEIAQLLPSMAEQGDEATKQFVSREVHVERASESWTMRAHSAG